MNTSIQEHYNAPDIRARVENALHAAGLDSQPLEWAQLAPLDQFHVGGLAATQEMARALNLPNGAHVLDVGSGLGGPARYLAAECGYEVTGIDLSESFVEVARMLTERCGLSERVSFVRGDALDLPFADESFDAAWTQHVAMNIADRQALYREIRRVVKPGGSLACYDIIEGNGEPLQFPLPWARTPENSFLLSEGAMRAALESAGWTPLLWEDVTPAAINALGAQMASALSPLNLGVVMGDDFAQLGANIPLNVRAGRLRLIKTILRRD